MNQTDCITLLDYAPAEIREILDLASEMKAEPAKFRGGADGRILALVFEKPSLRTRTTFQVAMAKLGGDSIYLAPSDVGLGKRESIADVARNLERWVDAIAARVFAHSAVTELAKWADIPVINALCDRYHPCQALADFLTLREHLGNFPGRRLCYVGDGNNVAHSLMIAGAKLGMDVTVVTPKGFEPAPEIVAAAQAAAGESDCRVVVANDLDAVNGADAVYTDVWASMGQEEEAAERARIFRDYQVNDALMRRAKPKALFLHCLPAHRGDEVTDEVADSPTSVIFDEAENRLWAQMALLHLLLAR